VNEIVEILPSKRVRGIADGRVEVEISARGKSATLRVEITDNRTARAFHFENDIEPLFARYGCNSSGCHG